MNYTEYSLYILMSLNDLLQMIPNGVRDLTECFKNDSILQHDHRVPVLGKHAVLEKVPEHSQHLHHEVDLRKSNKT